MGEMHRGAREEQERGRKRSERKIGVRETEW